MNWLRRRIGYWLLDSMAKAAISSALFGFQLTAKKTHEDDPDLERAILRIRLDLNAFDNIGINGVGMDDL